MKKKFTAKKTSLLTRATTIMNVPLESERHPQSPLLAKSPLAQDIADYWMAIDVQKELIRMAHEEALALFKDRQEQERRLLHEYHTTYEDKFPSLTIDPLSP